MIPRPLGSSSNIVSIFAYTMHKGSMCPSCHIARQIVFGEQGNQRLSNHKDERWENRRRRSAMDDAMTPYLFDDGKASMRRLRTRADRPCSHFFKQHSAAVSVVIEQLKQDQNRASHPTPLMAKDCAHRDMGLKRSRSSLLDEDWYMVGLWE